MPVDDPNFMFNDPELARDYVDHMLNGKRRDEGVPVVDGSFFVGHEVELHGLNARPELNGRRGKAVKVDTKTGRVGVELEGSSVLALKITNLKLASVVDAENEAKARQAVQQAAMENYAASFRMPLEPELVDLRVALVDADKPEPDELKPTAAEVVDVMRRSEQNMRLQEQGCEALACFSKEGPVGKSAVRQAAGAEAVVAAMSASKPADVGVLRGACRALANLANGDAACKEAVKSTGAARLVVKAMKAHKDDQRLQHMGCGVLANLANGDDDCQEVVVKAGGTAVLVEALRAHSGDVSIQGDGLLAIANLAAGRQHGKDAICDADAVPVVVTALRKHPDDKVQQWGLAALTNLSNGDGECKQAVCEGQGLQMMLKIMAQRRQDPGVQKMICGALAHLSRNEEDGCKELILRCGGHQSVLASMDMHPQEECVQEEGCHVLVSLAFGGASEKRAICDAGAAATLTRALQNHPGAERLHNMASAILQEINGVWENDNLLD